MRNDFSAADWLEQGKVAFAGEHYDRALRAFGECVVSAPRWSLALYWLGITLARLGRYGEALTCLTMAEPRALMEERGELLSNIHMERAIILRDHTAPGGIRDTEQKSGYLPSDGHSA